MSNSVNKKVIATNTKVVENNVGKESSKMLTKYIGCGAAGNKAICEYIKQGGVDPKDVLLINSTSKDFPKGFEEVDRIILSTDDSGCGKQRSTSKNYTYVMLKSGQFDEYVKGYSNVVIVTSVEGGTGSGSAPVIGQYCTCILSKVTRIVGFIGFEEDVRGLENTVSFFQDLDFDCAVNTIKNSLFGENKLEAEHLANLEMCKQLSILSGKEIIASSQNMDDTDIQKLINTCGYCVADKIYFDDVLMDTTAFDKLCKQMIYSSKSLSSEYHQIRLGVILNIKPESYAGVDYKFKVLKDTYGSTPFETFSHIQYDGERQYISFIAVGMKLPLNEVQEVYEKYREETQMVDKSKDNFFSAISQFKKEEDDNYFDMINGEDAKPTMSRDAFFNQSSGTVSKE